MSFMTKSIYFLLVSLYTSCFLAECSDPGGKEETASSDGGKGRETEAVDASIDTDTGSTTDHDSRGDTDRDNGYRVTASLSEEIPTVGIVTWSFDRAPLTDAHIEYGRDGEIEYTAPVDLDEPKHRTLLLGMKPSTEYVFRVVATDGTETYKSGDHAITTGTRPTGLPNQTVTGASPDSEGGFIITCSYTTGVSWFAQHQHQCVLHLFGQHFQALGIFVRSLDVMD